MIPYGRQSISWADAFAVSKAVKADWITMGPTLEKFESQLADFTKSRHVVAVSSGSAALHCAYGAIQLEPGDEIITSPLTFASTATTAINLGATVVFADVQSDTGNLDPAAVEARITPRTKAVVAVDYAGHPADLSDLQKITRKNGIVLIEDAAHALGSTYRSLPVGSVADITTFSFFPTKNITSGEGGAVLAKREDLAQKARLFRSHGLVRNSANFRTPDEGPWHQEVQSFGLNYRMADILAALASRQLARISKFKANRRKAFARYSKGLMNLEVLLPIERNYVESMWHLYPIRVEAGRRRSVFESLRKRGVLAQVNYLPVYWHPYFEDLGFRRGLCPIAETFYKQEISLPMFSGLKRAQQDFIAEALAKSLSNANDSC